MQDFLVNSVLPFTIFASLAVAGGAWLARIILYFVFRIRDWKRGHPNPYEKKETMGLPKGAMRTFLALSFTAIATLLLLKGSDFVGVADKKWILGELGVIITFYFGSKTVETYVDSQVKKKAIEKAQNTDEAIKVFKAVEEKPESDKS